jgi:HD-like signal output (HDOD) protein
VIRFFRGLKAAQGAKGRPAEATPNTAARPNPVASPSSDKQPGPQQATVSPATDHASSLAKHLLFVDGDPTRLETLKQTLASLARTWALTFVENPTAAIERMAKDRVDAVIAPLDLPGTTGVAFLNDMARLYPRALRFIRCAPQDRKLIPDSVGAPQHFSTELTADGAVAVVMRALRIEQWKASEPLRNLLNRVHKLPALPGIYTQVLQELQSPTASIEFVAKLIAKDPVMTAKMLQLVNSAVFALPREIDDPIEAVMFLGAALTKSLILLHGVFSQFDKTQCRGFDPEALWRHLMAVGCFARIVAQLEKQDGRTSDLCFTAGLLHDIGKLLLAANLPTEYSQMIDQSQRRNVPLRHLEFEVLGTTHAEVGACLLGTWGLPLPILEAIAWHHLPTLSDDNSFSLLTSVHVANAIDHEKTALSADILVSHMDADYLKGLSLAGRRNRWRERCGSPIKPQDEESRAKT